MRSVWIFKTFAGARFWRMQKGDLRARIHLTPDGDYYWDVAIVSGASIRIIDQGREQALHTAQSVARGRLGYEARKAGVTP